MIRTARFLRGADDAEYKQINGDTITEFDSRNCTFFTLIEKMGLAGWWFVLREYHGYDQPELVIFQTDKSPPGNGISRRGC